MRGFVRYRLYKKWSFESFTIPKVLSADWNPCLKCEAIKNIITRNSNSKLIDRGIRFVSDELKISNKESEKLIKKYNSVRKAIKEYKKKET